MTEHDRDPNNGRDGEPAGDETPAGGQPGTPPAAGDPSVGNDCGEELDDLKEQLSDIENRVLEDLDEANPQESIDKQLDEARKELEQLGDDLARARADHYNVTQQYNNYVRRSKTDITNARSAGRDDVLDALIPVLDDIEAARSADALEGPFAAIATKLESVLASRCSFERFGEVGEEFDPAIHEAVLATPSTDVENDTVQQVVQSGIKSGDRIIRPAKVIVAKPE